MPRRPAAKVRPGGQARWRLRRRALGCAPDAPAQTERWRCSLPLVPPWWLGLWAPGDVAGRPDKSVARRAQGAGRGEELIGRRLARDPALGDAGCGDLVGDGRQGGVRRLHRLAQRARRALRDPVLIAPVVGDDVLPAAP